ENINPPIDPNAHFVTRRAEIKSIKDAQNAIERIKGEGEGAPGDPDQPANPDRLAHYYVFKEIFVGNVLSFDPKSGRLVPVSGMPKPFPLDLSIRALHGNAPPLNPPRSAPPARI